MPSIQPIFCFMTIGHQFLIYCWLKTWHRKAPCGHLLGLASNWCEIQQIKDSTLKIQGQGHRQGQQERLKCRNTLRCLDQYAAQNSKYARPPIPSQPPTQKVFFQWHTQYDPTVKHSHCSNGCSLNWFTPSEFFQFSQLSNQLVSLKNANDVHKKLNLVWVWN